MNRRRFVLSAAALAALPAAVRAHHGYMRWDEENPVSIEGWVSKEMTGFPHWEVDIRVDGEDWEIDLGDQWQLQKAGMKDDGSDFVIGRVVRVDGLRPMDKSLRRILPNRFTFENGETYEIEVRG